MKREIPKRVEDIYPLTIVSPRYTDGVVIFHADCDTWFVDKVQGTENALPLLPWLEENVYPCCYGYGLTVEAAFEHYQSTMAQLLKDNLL